MGDARGQLARGLVGEGDDKQRLGFDAFVRDEMDDALDQCKSLAGTRPRDDEHRAIGGKDGFELLRVGFGLKGDGAAAGHFAPPSSLPNAALPIHCSRSPRRKRHISPSLNTGSLPLATRRR